MITWLFWSTQRLVTVTGAVLALLLGLGVLLAQVRLGGEPVRAPLAGTAVAELPTAPPVKMIDPIPVGIKATESFLRETGDPSKVTAGHVAVEQNDYLTEARIQTTAGTVLVDLTPDGRNWAVLSVNWAS